MRIGIGTQNKAKVEAVTDVLREYAFLKDAIPVPMDVSSGVSSHPTSLDETIRGAITRSKNAFQDCELSIGIESGVIPVPHTQTGHMAFTVCSIFDGKKCALGVSPGFEFPPTMTKLILSGVEGSHAAVQAGLTDDPHVGSKKGIIGLLSNDRITRKDLARYAILTAMVQLEKKEWYS